MNLSVIGTIYFVWFLLFFIFFIVGTYVKTQWKKNVMVYTVIIILTLFAGLRWEIGTDWDNYYQLFKEINFSNFYSDYFYHYDMGYRIFNCIISFFTKSYTVFLIILTFISIYAVHVSLKKMEVDELLGMWIFYSNYFIGTYLGSNRRIIAIGFVMLAITYAFYGKNRLTILFEIIAALFHWTSLCSVIALVVPKKIVTKTKMCIILGISFVLGATQATRRLVQLFCMIMGKMGIVKLAAVGQYYIQINAEDLGITHFVLAVIKRVAVLVIVYYCYSKWTESKSNKFEYFYNLFFVSVCIYLLFNGLGVFQVLSTYFAIMELFMWGALYQVLRKEKKIYFVIFLFGLYMAETLASFPAYIDLYIPYKTIFNLQA